MSAKDKGKNKAQEIKGKVKQATGRASRNPSTEMSGRREQVRADLKNAGEHVKDAAGKFKDSLDH